MDTVVISRRLRVARALRELTCDALARSAGVNKSTVSRYECGFVARPSMPLLDSFSRALDVNFAWLIGGDVPATRDPFDAHWCNVKLEELSGLCSPVSYWN